MVDRLKTHAGCHITASTAAAQHAEIITLRFGGAVVGTLVGVAEDGAPVIDFPANPNLRHQAARTCVEIGKTDVGKSVVLQFDEGDHLKPIVIGVIQLPDPARATPVVLERPVSAEADCGVVELIAADTLTLRCGSASITLTSDGKVMVKGTQIHTRSTGVNRIQGASVRIN